MANFDLTLDVDSGRLLNGFLSTRATTPPNAVFGDQQAISVRLVEPNSNDAELPWRDLDLTGQTIRVGIGSPGAIPTGGTYTLTFGADTTTALAYDATASDVETALDLLTSVIAAGGVSVVAYGTSGFRVEFGNDGDVALMTADTDGLVPTSSAYIETSRAGDGSTAEVQIVSFEQDNAAYIELSTDLTAPAATITTVRTGVTATTSEIQNISISGDPYAGTYTLTIDSEETGNLEVDSTSDAIKTAIEGLASIAVDDVTVTGDGLDYTVEFNKSLGDVGAATADLTNLSAPVGKKGTLNLNTTGMLELLDGDASKAATLEIVRFTTSGSISDTVYQGAISCRQDVIPDTPASATPLPVYPTLDVVGLRFETETETGTTRTLTADDAFKHILFTNAAGCVVTFNTSVFAEGDEIAFEQRGAVEVTFDGTGTINAHGDYLEQTDGVNSVIAMRIDSAGEASLVGQLELA